MSSVDGKEALGGTGGLLSQSPDTSMDTNIPSGQLLALSFLVFWVLFATLLFSAVRTGLSAGPSDDDPAQARDRSGG